MFTVVSAILYAAKLAHQRIGDQIHVLLILLAALALAGVLLAYVIARVVQSYKD